MGEAVYDLVEVSVYVGVFDDMVSVTVNVGLAVTVYVCVFVGVPVFVDEPVAVSVGEDVIDGVFV